MVEKMEKPNVKLQRINTDIYRIIATYIQERGIATEVVDVKTSADLSECKVFVTTDNLVTAANYLRGEIAKKLNLKNTPKLRFILDKGRENAERVEELLGQIRKTK